MFTTRLYVQLRGIFVTICQSNMKLRFAVLKRLIFFASKCIYNLGY